MEAIATLNRICHEVGVCSSEPEIKHAAELYKDGSNRRVRVACFEDGVVTSCVVEVDGEGKTQEQVCCYTAESGGEELFYSWQAHLTSPEVGYKIRPVEVG